MSYIIFISTDCEDDLKKRNCELVRFTRELPFDIEAGLLSNKNVWHVKSKEDSGGPFRHSPEPNSFALPQDWYPEDKADIEATIIFMDTVRYILQNEFDVDCINMWCHDASWSGDPVKMTVDLSDIKNEEFRFFENHIFEFKIGVKE